VKLPLGFKRLNQAQGLGDKQHARENKKGSTKSGRKPSIKVGILKAYLEMKEKQ
jgi:hypothetical protein